MDCENKVIKKAAESLNVGMSLDQVNLYLNKLDQDYTYYSKQQLISMRDKDAQNFNGKILMMIDIKTSSHGLQKATEVLKVGFDDDSNVKEVSCNKIYTGL